MDEGVPLAQSLKSHRIEFDSSKKGDSGRKTPSPPETTAKEHGQVERGPGIWGHFNSQRIESRLLTVLDWGTNCSDLHRTEGLRGHGISILKLGEFLGKLTQ